MFEIPIQTPKEIYEDDLWIKSECYRYYVEQRKKHCTFMEILDLWLIAPYCVECAISEPMCNERIPDIVPNGWEMDLMIHVGIDFLQRTKKSLRKDKSFCFECKKCKKELRPWRNDEVYIVNYHLEEHYGIEFETNKRKRVSRTLQSRVINLYDRKCLRCGSDKNKLHIDHIFPQSAGGGAAFRNLQPLCETCGNIKANKLPTEKEVWSKMYFDPYPSDSYEHMFW